MSHTPGPWAVYYDHPTCPTIAFIRGVGKPRHDDIAIAYAVDNDVARADVRLLAAAPELLAALIEYIAAADNSIESENGDDIAAMLRFGEALNKARAAIRLATGGA